jgi:DNA-binding transcriptional LysR family regulator
MHIETLKTFCDLVETGSFNKAAQLNFVSQSAVSQQLKALETRYNRRLIERGLATERGAHRAGRLFYADCKALLERFRVLEERLREPAAAMADRSRSRPSTASGCTSCRRTSRDS